MEKNNNNTQVRINRAIVSTKERIAEARLTLKNESRIVSDTVNQIEELRSAGKSVPRALTRNHKDHMNQVVSIDKQIEEEKEHLKTLRKKLRDAKSMKDVVSHHNDNDKDAKPEEEVKSRRSRKRRKTDADSGYASFSDAISNGAGTTIPKQRTVPHYIVRNGKVYGASHLIGNKLVSVWHDLDDSAVIAVVFRSEKEAKEQLKHIKDKDAYVTPTLF